MILVTHQ